MKNLKIILLTLSIITFQLHGAERPPQPPSKKLLTFEQMIEQGQERRVHALQQLPPDIRREMLRINLTSEPTLNIPAMAKEILNTAGINKAFRTAVNNPQNMLKILQSLPKAGAKYLAEKLEKLPVMQSAQVQEWLKDMHLAWGQKLYEAIDALEIENPDMNVIINILNNPNIDVNWKNDNGLPILNRAVIRGLTNVVRLLIATGANVNSSSHSGNTALMSACALEYTNIVQILLEAGANVNATNNEDYTALMMINGSTYASQESRTKIIKLLLDAGVDIDAKNKYGSTALMLAAFEGNLEAVEQLLEAGANPLMINENQETARMRAHDRLSSLNRFDPGQKERKDKFREIIKLLENAERMKAS